MSLRDKTIKNEYRSLIDSVIQDFFIPLLCDAVSYDRAVGFFSSSALIEISKGIAAMARNGGKIRLVASPCLSEEDVEAIKQGYQAKEKIIEGALIRELSDKHADYYSMKRLNLLANLIADGVMDIRIALTDNSCGLGIYHEKMGIIRDSDGNEVAFSGSMNESKTAMEINYEAIDVFRDWVSADAERVVVKKSAFEAIWNDNEPNIKVMKFPNVTDAIIKKYRRAKPDFSVDAEQFTQREQGQVFNTATPRKTAGARIPSDVMLHDYQQKAITAWVGENYRGIFDMATGTGKTFTGLGAVSKLSQDLCDRLAVFIVVPYQHLVTQWAEDIERFNISPIIAYSSSPQKNWKDRLKKAVTDQRLPIGKDFFCVVSTNATFAGKFMQEQINAIGAPILLVVDEAHNFGARNYAKLLDDRFTYRLALSATIERYGDEEGTELLYHFFGRKCIEYSLEKAIEEDKLTPYKYYPVLVYLTEDELIEYEQLSVEIEKCLVKHNGKRALSTRGKILAMKRARLVAGAENKLETLLEVIKDYKDDNNLLVYCGAATVDFEPEDASVDAGEMRQIEAVTRILGNKMNMRVARFTSLENADERKLIRQHFQSGELQAIVAIKCLDEGVNIPGIRTAFILASTTNPKEYIQRRGRVLRKAPNKPFARIYDFVTLPRPLETVQSLTDAEKKRSKALVKNELARLKEFGQLAQNAWDAHELISKIEETYALGSDETSEEDD